MNTDITVLFGTMTGNARDCAEKAVETLGKTGLTAEAVDLAQYDPRKLLEETTVLLAISTWGEGEPPDDAVNFYDYVKSLEGNVLSNLRFAVFALGDTSYDEFCKCGKDLDTIFEERGGRRLLDRVDNDVDYTDALEKWCEEIVPIVQDAVAVS